MDGYPITYDNLEVIDFNDCVLASNSLSDGILDELEYIELDSVLTFFVKYTYGTPKASLISPVSEEYLLQDIPGVYSELTGLYSFTLNIPAIGTLNSTQTDMWREMVSLLRIDSIDNNSIFMKRLNIISEGSKPATRTTVNELGIKMDELLSNELKQTENIITASNGWKVIL